MKYDKESYFDISELYIFVGGPNLCYKVEDEKRVGVYRYYDILTDKLVLKLCSDFNVRKSFGGFKYYF